jgi:hypothetical protein
VRRTDRRRSLFIEKQGRIRYVVKKGRDEIKSTGNKKVPKKLMPDPVKGK